MRTEESLRADPSGDRRRHRAARARPRNAKPEPQGADGDLSVIVRTAPDERFERRGPHLYRSESVSVTDAALGTTLAAADAGPRVRVKLKPGTQLGTMLRVASKGLPIFRWHNLDNRLSQHSAAIRAADTLLWRPVRQVSQKLYDIGVSASRADGPVAVLLSAGSLPSPPPARVYMLSCPSSQRIR